MTTRHKMPHRLHHSYRAGYWGLAYGFERLANENIWFIHLGRKVWVFA